VVAVPTTGQSASSSSCALGSLTADFSAGHSVATGEETFEMAGCLLRLWWWSVVAPTTGHCKIVSNNGHRHEKPSMPSGHPE
jgi:hypothetical protein